MDFPMHFFFFLLRALSQELFHHLSSKHTRISADVKQVEDQAVAHELSHPLDDTSASDTASFMPLGKVKRPTLRCVCVWARARARVCVYVCVCVRVCARSRSNSIICGCKLLSLQSEHSSLARTDLQLRACMLQRPLCICSCEHGKVFPLTKSTLQQKKKKKEKKKKKQFCTN